jgi:hypothetical protein
MAWAVPIRVSGQLVSGITGKPAVMQDNSGEFHLLVLQGNRLAHYRKRTPDPGAQWLLSFDLPIPGPGSGDISQPPHTPLNVCVFQDIITNASAKRGNLEAIVQLQPAFGPADFLAAYSFDFDDELTGWNGPFPIQNGPGNPISNVTGNPAVTQDSFGHWHLVVPQGNRLAYYRLVPGRPHHQWIADGEVELTGRGVQPPTPVIPVSAAVTFRSGNPGGVEIVMHVQPLIGDDFLLAHLFEEAPNNPSRIEIDGGLISGVTKF